MIQNTVKGPSSKKARRFRREKLNVKFSDVLGCNSAKSEIKEIIQFLENPSIFQKVGARQPKGALLSGPPGTGKTMLAKAAAAEANVPFYYISGSEFVEKYVGVGAANVRGLFSEAKKTSPSIIFIDEIDAIGQKRDSVGSSGGEKETTLNQLLVEMDGFDSSDKVIVIAATNTPESLDPALKRPGRFDRLITVDLPDFQGRMEILQLYLDKIRLEDAVNGEKVDTNENLMKPDYGILLESFIHANKNINISTIKLNRYENIIEKAKIIALMEHFPMEDVKKNFTDEEVEYITSKYSKIKNLQKEESKKKESKKKPVKKKKFVKKYDQILSSLIEEDLKKISHKFYDITGMQGQKFDILQSEAIKKDLAREESDRLLKLEANENRQFINDISVIKLQANRLATLTPNFSGADLKNLCNEAAILAVREEHEHVWGSDFEEASERILGGLKKSDEIEEEVRRTVAIHESGHAVAAWYLKGADPLVKVTIIPRSKGALGFAQYLVSDSKLILRDELKDRIKFVLGGRIAEELFIGKISTGAHDDLEKAFHMASQYVASFGMCER